MKMRLNILSNLFRREVLITCLLLGGIFFVIPSIILLVNQAHPVFYLLLLLLNLLCLIGYLCSFALSAEFDEGTVIFTEYHETAKGDRKRIHFTVTDVRDMEFIQNKLERRLNIGRILFRGNAEMDPVYPLKESQSTIFLLCGIPHFAEFQAKMEQGDQS